MYCCYKRMSAGCFLMALVVVLVPQMAYAGINTPMGNVLCTVQGWFSGNTGKGLATIAVATVGVWKLLGKISGRAAMLNFVGIAILFGAAGLVEAMGAGAPGGCPTT